MREQVGFKKSKTQYLNSTPTLLIFITRSRKVHQTNLEHGIGICIIGQRSLPLLLSRSIAWSTKSSQFHSKAVPLRHSGATGERSYSSYTFLISTLDRVCGQLHSTAALYPWARIPDNHWIGGWVGLRAGLDKEDRGKILYLCRGSNPGSPLCSQTLYQRFPNFYSVHTP
jgi:hypothetical protein